MRAGRLLAGAALVAGAATTALGTVPAAASSVQVSAVGSLATYALMHDLFPTSLDDLLPGGTTGNQRIQATPSLCAGGVAYGAGDPVPNGSVAGVQALEAEATAPADEQGCIDFARSSAPPQPGTGTSGARLDYYAYALDAVAPLVGKSAGGTRTSPATLTLTAVKAVYRCKPGSTNWRTVTGGADAPIVRFWPQPGSGTRAVYADVLGFTPLATHATTPSSTCTTPPIWQFTRGGTTVGNEEDSEAGIVYQASIDPTTPVADAIAVYSAGRFASQWDTAAHYGRTRTNPITGTAIGNFNAATLLLAQMQNRVHPATTSPFAFFSPQAGAFNATTNRGAFAPDTTVVNEANEWYSHLPSASSPATASTAAVPGVSYVFNVADAALPTYSEAKAMIGFDNRATGTRSALCSGDDATTIAAAGFVPLNRGTTAPPTSDLAGATCRELPGDASPGFGHARSWTAATWTPPTGSGTGTGGAAYSPQPGYPALDNTGTTLPVTTVAAGDVLLVMAHVAPSSGTSHVTSITDSAGRVTWQAAESAGITADPSGDVVEIWYGVVKTAGATTIDVHWSGTTFDHFVWAAEWRSALGAAAFWSVSASGGKSSSLCAVRACDFPTLTAGTAAGLYWGWAYPATTGRAGTTPGVSYYVTTEPTHGNVLAWDATVPAHAALTPVFGQTTPTTWYDAVAVMMTASG